MPEPIQLVGRIAIVLEHRNEFIRCTKNLCDQTITSESPLLFQCCEDLSAPGRFIFYEIWSCKEDLMCHFQATHFLAWNNWLQGKIVGEPEVRIVSMDATEMLIL